MVLPFFPCPFHRYYYKEKRKYRDFMPIFSEDVVRSSPPLFFCGRRYFFGKTNTSLLHPFVQSHVPTSVSEEIIRMFRTSELRLLWDVCRASTLRREHLHVWRFCCLYACGSYGALVWRIKHSWVVVVFAASSVVSPRRAASSFCLFRLSQQLECWLARKIRPLCEQDFAESVFRGLVNSSQCGIV